MNGQIDRARPTARQEWVDAGHGVRVRSPDREGRERRFGHRARARRFGQGSAQAIAALAWLMILEMTDCVTDGLAGLLFLMDEPPESL